MKRRIANWSLFFCIFFFLIVSLVYYYYDKEKYELNDFVRGSSSGNFVKLKHGFVHYELAGPENGELVVLVHGAGSGYYAWNKNFQIIADAGYRVLRYDLYGRGLSDRPEETYDLALFNNQLSELLDSLSLNKPFHLVSVSMGAMVALQQTKSNADKIKKIIFIDPAAIDNGEKGWMLRMPYLSDFVMTTYWVPRAVQKQMAEFYRPENVNEYATLSEEHLKYYGLKRAMISTWLNTCNRDMKSELKELGSKNKKILLLWGDHDPLTPIVLSKKYMDLMSGVQFYKIPNAGHLSNYEQPELVNKYIIDFLKN